MEMLSNLILGFSTVLQPTNLLFCFLGALLGTLTGVLPGLGPVGAMCMLFPLTFKFPPVTGLIMLSGIYYGAMYGGSTTSILVNVPGEAASVVTTLDGYMMAKQGFAGPALGIAAFGSFIAGTIGILLLMGMAPFLSEFALSFGPPEYFAVMFAALTIITYLATGTMMKAWIMILFGLISGIVGQDIFTGEERFTLGIPTLRDGLGIAPVVMGIFGLGEIFVNIEEKIGTKEALTEKIKGILPSLQHWKESAGSIIRGTFLGFFLGFIPGGGAVIASFASYAVEKKLSKHPERFGKGAIQGVAGPESANNAATAGAFVPLLTLGLPSNVVMAILVAAFLVHGIQPGPLLISKYPEIFWGVIASMYVGNIMLLILNIPLIPMWVKVLKIPYSILFPIIFLLCFLGVYSINFDVVEIYIMLFFGVIGYVMRKCKFEGAPFAMAFILSRMMESAFKQSLKMSYGQLSIFFERPISVIFMVIAFLSILSNFLPYFTRYLKKMKSNDSVS